MAGLETITALRQGRGMSLADLAARLGVTRATVQDYERSDSRGTMRADTRQRVLAAMGARDESMTPDQVRSLLLHTLIAAQLVADPKPVIDHARGNLQRWAEKGQHDTYWLERWRRALESPPAQIALLITERTQDASDMRQGTPFAGVLGMEHRRAAIERSRELHIALAT